MKPNTNSTTMSRFGTTYDINAINNAIMKNGLKPLTPAQISKMSPAQIKRYLASGKSVLRDNARNMKKVGRQFRRNAKLTTSENFKQAQLMHTTIRQGLAELGTLGTQALAQHAISRNSPAISAVQQNTQGGTESQPDDGNTGVSEKGPVYAKRRRDEE